MTLEDARGIGVGLLKIPVYPVRIAVSFPRVGLNSREHKRDMAKGEGNVRRFALTHL
jgi:hypothetical protein